MHHQGSLLLKYMARSACRRNPLPPPPLGILPPLLQRRRSFTLPGVVTASPWRPLSARRLPSCRYGAELLPFPAAVAAGCSSPGWVPLQGIVPFVAVDCDKESNRPLCGQYGVQVPSHRSVVPLSLPLPLPPACPGHSPPAVRALLALV